MRTTAKEKAAHKEHKNTYTMAELAHYLGVRRQTIKNWVHRGIIPDAELRSDSGWRLWTNHQARTIMVDLTSRKTSGKL